MCVSIPSSSGHQFTVLQVLSLRAYVRKRFQSLLHQGISLLLGRLCTGAACDRPRFNPFFIRASVYCVPLTVRKGAQSRLVSIPSSSGHQFTEVLRNLFTGLLLAVSIPSSSGHQFTGPLTWRQSLTMFTVSIPSSSGHQFTASPSSAAP